MRTINFFLSLVVFLSASALIAQEDFRKTAPKAGPAPKIQLGTYEQFELNNGLKVIAVENNKVPRVSFQLFVDVPPLLEGDKAGTASMAGQLLNKGTTSKSKAEIDESIDFIGASLSTSGSGLYAASLTKHKDKLLEVMTDVLYNPSFPEVEFEKLKTQTLSGLASEKDDPNAIAANVADVLRFGKDHPYGELVTEETVDNITLEACKAYYNTYFKPNISYLVVVGDISADEVKMIAEKYFGKWEKGVITKPTIKMPDMPTATTVDFVAKPGAVQSVIAVTYPVELKPGSEDAIKARVMNTLFGGYFRSRLNNNIREDKGYSYGVRSTLSSDKHVGYFSAGGSVRNEVTDSAIVEFLKEMKDLNTLRVEEEELTLVKNVLSGGFARQLERPETVARFALNTALYNLPKDYYATYLEKISAVTPSDILAMAKKYLSPEKAHLLVVGNKAEVADKLTSFAADGKVNFYDFYGNAMKETAALPADLTAEKVLAKYMEVIGGEDKLKAVTDLTMKMSTSIQGMTMQMSTYQKDGKFAMQVGMAGNIMQEQKYDGTKAISVEMGSKQNIEGAALDELKITARPFPETNMEELGISAKLVNAEIVNGKEAYQVELTYPTGRKVSEFFDVETGFKVRRVEEENGNSLVTDLKEYAEVDGIMLPHVLSVSGMLPMPIVMKAESIDVNKGIEDSIFVIE